MKVAFVGKGGAGKTTVAALFARYVAAQGFPVIAIDADINQQLPAALGAVDLQLPAMGLGTNAIKAYVRGTNPRIASHECMIKTTPPGAGSRLMTVTEDNAVYDRFAVSYRGIRLMAAGAYAQEDLGIKCYHSKTGAVELFLNHLIDWPSEYVVTDMTAGADAFASGLFTRFDVTFIMVEPTLKSLAVYDQYARYADGYGVTLKVIANKLTNAADQALIAARVGEDYLTGIQASEYVRRMEQGCMGELSQLEPANSRALTQMREFVDAQQKNWERYYRQTVEFHIKNAEAWGNAQLGMDLAEQVDPLFDLSAAVAAGEQRLPA